MYKFYTQLEFKDNTYTILKKDFRNYRMYGIIINDCINDYFSITEMEYHKEEFLLNKLVQFLHKKHFEPESL